MISDQERREAAAKLRGLDEHIDGVPPMCSPQVHNAMALSAIRAVVGKGDIFHLLADLIDRPVTRNLSEKPEFVCEGSTYHFESGFGWICACKACDAQGEIGKTKAEAIKNWNRRVEKE